MSKKTRAEKRAEEARILAEMDEAMAEKPAQETQDTEKVAATEERTEQRAKWYQDATPSKIHCKHCKTLMENGVCPNCGYHIYVPMDKRKRDKIRWIVGGVCLVVFLGLFIWLKARS